MHLMEVYSDTNQTTKLNLDTVVGRFRELMKTHSLANATTKVTQWLFQNYNLLDLEKLEAEVTLKLEAKVTLLDLKNLNANHSSKDIISATIKCKYLAEIQALAIENKREDIFSLPSKMQNQAAKQYIERWLQQTKLQQHDKAEIVELTAKTLSQYLVEKKPIKLTTTDLTQKFKQKFAEYKDFDQAYNAFTAIFPMLSMQELENLRDKIILNENDEVIPPEFFANTEAPENSKKRTYTSLIRVILDEYIKVLKNL